MTDEMAKSISEALKASGGGNAWLAGIVVICSAGVMIVILLKVAVPIVAAISKLSETLALLGQVVAKIDDQIKDSHKMVEDSNESLAMLVAAKEIDIRAFDKIAAKAGIDLAPELGEMRGTLRRVRASQP